MSTSSATNMTLCIVLSTTGFGYLGYHTYRFDRWRCLLPSKKDWFRVLLTWMLIMSFIALFIWGAGWTCVKNELGWIILPGIGAVPFPNQLWSQKYKDLNLPLSFWVTFAYWLQVSLNAEEGLYWYHLMRAVRRPKSAKAWLTSSFFYSWIVISITCGIIQFGIAWIDYEDMVVQSGRMYTGGGIIELVVVLASSIVIFKFPAFLRDVLQAQVRKSDLVCIFTMMLMAEANKVRTFFRVVFATSVLILGVDGLTHGKKINMNPIASDMLQQIAFGAYWLAGIVSIMLYLPRNWSGSNGYARVMVGANDPSTGPANQLASNALMSLLREGGQWDEIDDEMVNKTRTGRGRNEGDDRSGKEEWGGSPAQTPRALENWSSPFAVQTTEDIPREIRIHVEQQREVDYERTEYA